ncbi:hypothetical protein [Paenibacillus etheri]|uniref:hypothetical protein n=1 Tax=Paenibacillus etheri TaxID=1306852 RepID=UPI000A53023E|nr:hypothetical protein [Paenibacillus etheri]
MIHAPFLLFLNCTYYNISLQVNLQYEVSELPRLLFIAKQTGSSTILGGSTNFTIRNLDDYNLENDLWISMKRDQPLFTDMEAYFNRLWINELQTNLGFTTF